MHPRIIAVVVIALAGACTTRGGPSIHSIAFPTPEGDSIRCLSRADAKTVQTYHANVKAQANIDTLKKASGDATFDFQQTIERIRNVTPDVETLEAMNLLMCANRAQRLISAEVYEQWTTRMYQSLLDRLSGSQSDTSGTLPILRNPALRIAGVWRVEYSEVSAYQENAGRVPITLQAGGDSTHSFEATIKIDKNTSRLRGSATAEGRTWTLEGFVDNNAIVYVYKDPENPNSFGSAVVRVGTDPRQLVGLWAGVSPSFKPSNSNASVSPFLVGGWVRWRYAGK